MATHASQADFARLLHVSRKTVTTWKKRGYIEVSDGLVDVAQSLLKLRQAGRDVSVAVTGTAASRREWPAVVTGPDDYDWTQRNGIAVGIEPVASYLAIMADCAVIDLAPLLVRHLAPDVSLALLNEFHRVQRQGAVGLLVDDHRPPAGYAGWADHPVFHGPAMSACEWEEVLAEAEEWRKAQAGADA